MRTILSFILTVTFVMLVVSPAHAASSKPPTPQTMRALANRIAQGSPSAFNELRDIAEQLYLGIDYARERSRVMTNLTLMRAAYDVLGEQAAKGNRWAFDALKKSLKIKHLGSFAPDALGIAAAAGRADALDILLEHDKWGILLSSAVFALQKPAAKNNPKAIEFLIAVLNEPRDRPLWLGAAVGLAEANHERGVTYLITEMETHPTDGCIMPSAIEGLNAAAARGNAKARLALEKRSTAAPTTNIIGVVVEKVDDHGLHVRAVVSGSPASRAGIRAGDIIVEANTRPLRGLTTNAALELMRGLPGCDVDVKVQRHDGKELVDIKIVQGAFPGTASGS